MANQPIIEKIKVEYMYLENGKTIRGAKRLVELTDKEKSSIVSLAVLPIKNVDGTNNKQNVDISKHIQGFPILSSLFLPIQLTNIKVGTIQKNGCPNLQQIVRTMEQGYEGEVENAIVKGAVKNTVEYNGQLTEKDLESYGIATGAGQVAVEEFKVSPKTASTKRTTTKKKYVTEQELDEKLSIIDSKLEDIKKAIGSSRSVSPSDIKELLKNIPTKEHLKRQLKTFVGRISSEELTQIVEAITNINITIETKELSKSVENIFNTKIQEISNIYSTRDDDLKKLIESLKTTAELDLTEDQKQTQILEILKSKIPDLIATNRTLTDKIFTKLSVLEREVVGQEGEIGLRDKLDNIEEYGELIFEELSKLGNEFPEFCNNMNFSEETKNYIIQMFENYSKTIVQQIQSGNTDILTNIQKSIENIVTYEDIEQIVSKHLGDFNIQNEELHISTQRYITDTIIEKINGLNGVTKDDLEVIENKFAELLTRDEFVEILNNVLNDSDIAKVSDVKETGEKIDAIETLIKKNHSEDLDKFQEIMGAFENVPTTQTIKEIAEDTLNRLISRSEKGKFEGLIPEFTDEIKSEIQVSLQEYFKNLALLPSMQGDINKIYDFMTSQAGKEATEREVLIKTIERYYAKSESDKEAYLAEIKRLEKQMQVNQQAINGQFEDVRDTLKGISSQFGALGEKIDSTGSEIKSQINENAEDINNNIANVGDRVDKVEAKVGENGEKIDGLGKQLGDISEQNGIIAGSVDELHKEHEELSARYEELSAKAEEINKFIEELRQQRKSTPEIEAEAHESAEKLAHGIYATGGNPGNITINNITRSPEVGDRTPEIVSAVIRELKNAGLVTGGIAVPTIIQGTPQGNEIEKLNKNIQDYTKIIQAQQTQIEELNKRVSELEGKGTQAEAGEGKGKTAGTGEKGKGEGKGGEQDDKKKKGVEKTVDPEPKKLESEKKEKIPVPQLRKQKLLKKSLDSLKKLKEPKLPWHKRLAKKIRKNPFLFALTGLGVGALVAGAATVIGVGGIGAAISIIKNASAWFTPTLVALKNIGIGAGVGLGTAGIVNIGMLFGRGAKKERLYRKFQKQYDKCHDREEDLEFAQSQVQDMQAKLDSIKEKEQSGNKLLKALGVYKRARVKNARKLRKLKVKARVAENQHRKSVTTALKTKDRLNKLEERDGKTLAQNGLLQKFRSIKGKYQSRIDAVSDNQSLDEDEKQDMISELEVERDDKLSKYGINHDGEELDGMSDEFKTFDSEAEELINSVKGKRTASLDRKMQDIMRRNSRTIETVEEKAGYDVREATQYEQAVKESPTEENKKAFGNFVEQFNALRKQRENEIEEGRKNGTTYESLINLSQATLDRLVREGQISKEEYVRILQAQGRQYDVTSSKDTASKNENDDERSR